MTSTASTLVIDSEESAIEMLKKALDGEYDNEYFELKFDGWPQLRIVYRGDDYDGELPTSVMRSFIELQETINKIYKDIVYQGGSHRLSDLERKEIELSFKIERGSVEVNVNLDKFLVKIGEAAMVPENFQALMITLGVVGVAWMAKQAFTTVTSSKDIQEQNRHNETQEQVRQNSETERLKLISEGIARVPALESTVDSLLKAQKELVLSAYNADEVDLGGNIFPRDVISEYSQRTRSMTEPRVFRGVFVIDGIRSKKPGKPDKSIHLIEREEGKMFVASFNKTDSEKFLGSDIARLYSALEKDLYIDLELVVREKDNGDITSARLVRIRDIVND